MGAELLSLGNNRARTAAANERPLPLSPASPGLRPEELPGFNHADDCVQGPTTPFFSALPLMNCVEVQFSYRKSTITQNHNGKRKHMCNRANYVLKI